MNWPFARSKTVTELARKLEVERREVRHLKKVCAGLGHQKKDALIRAGKTLQDMRIISVRLDDTRRHDPVRLTIEFAHELFLSSYRHDGMYREILGQMLETEVIRQMPQQTYFSEQFIEHP